MSQRGDNYYQQAEEKLKKFSLFESKKAKQEAAADLFTKAGNSYKSLKQFKKAGDAYMRASECYCESGYHSSSANSIADAAKIYSHDPSCIETAIDCYKNAAMVFRQISKPLNAAQLLQEAADLLLGQNNIEEALEVYGEASQIFDDEGNEMCSGNIQEKIADIKLQQRKWLEAATLYQQICDKRVGDKSLSFGSSEYCTKAIFCRLAADDLVGAQNIFNRYSALRQDWERSREHELVEKSLKAVEDEDMSELTDAVLSYDSIKPLDWLHQTIEAIKDLHDNPEDIC